MGQGVASAQQFPIELGKLIQALQRLLVSLDAAARLADLRFAFEQQGAHLSLGKAAAQIEERAVLFPLAAVAIGPAAFEEAFQKGGVDGVGRPLEGLQQAGLAPAQGQGGEALDLCLTHNMSNIAKREPVTSEKENAPSMRKCPTQG